MGTPVSSVVQAFAIMRVLADDRALTLSEIAQTCGISPSSCLGLLRTLVGEGVLHTHSGKRYALSPPWTGIVAGENEAAARLVALARPLLENAARKWLAPVGLWRVFSRDRLQLVALGEDVAATRIHMEEGQRQPIGGGSVGRALTAAQNVSEDEIRRRFSALRWQRPVTEANYRVQIIEAAARGYAIDDGLSYAGIASLAAAVSGEPPEFCFSVSMFAVSRSDREVARIGGDLKALAEQLGTATGGRCSTSTKAKIA